MPCFADSRAAKFVLIPVLLVALAGCGQGVEPPADDADAGEMLSADVLYTNGVIWTGTAGAPDAAAQHPATGNSELEWPEFS